MIVILRMTAIMIRQVGKSYKYLHKTNNHKKSIRILILYYQNPILTIPQKIV